MGDALASADALGRPVGAIQGDVIAGQRPTQGFRGRFRAPTTFDDSGAVRGHRNARARHELNFNAGLRPLWEPSTDSILALEPRECAAAAECGAPLMACEPKGAGLGSGGVRKGDVCRNAGAWLPAVTQSGDRSLFRRSERRRTIPPLATNRWTRWPLLDSHFLHHLREKSEPEVWRGRKGV